MTAPRDQPADASLSRVLDRPLDTCRAMIAEFRQAPTEAFAKRNIRGRMEPVTDIDLRVQDLLTSAFRAGFPGTPVIAEERLASLPPLPPDCLLIDPIDGTRPLLAGEPYFAIAACLVRHGRPEQAVIDLPAFGLRLTAAPGGLHVGGDPSRLPAFKPADVLTSPRHVSQLSRLLRRDDTPGPRAVPVPTATVKMLLVALGRAAAAVYLPGFDGAAPWDYAAGALAIAAAGGIARDDTGRDLARTTPALIDGWAASATGTDLRLLGILNHPAEREA